MFTVGVLLKVPVHFSSHLFSGAVSVVIAYSCLGGGGCGVVRIELLG